VPSGSRRGPLGVGRIPPAVAKGLRQLRAENKRLLAERDIFTQVAALFAHP
jgi:hypothetical protein